MKRGLLERLSSGRWKLSAEGFRLACKLYPDAQGPPAIALALAQKAIEGGMGPKSRDRRRGTSAFKRAYLAVREANLHPPQPKPGIEMDLSNLD
jgi:hypothetical protein